MPLKKKVTIFTLIVILVCQFSDYVQAYDSDFYSSNDVLFYQPDACIPTDDKQAGMVYILGDSITQSARDKYKENLGTNVSINARVGRDINSPGGGGNGSDEGTGIEAVEKDRGIISNSDVIVVALGSNGGTNDTSIKQLISSIRSIKNNIKIYWIDTYTNNTSYKQTLQSVNTAIYDNANTQNYTTISWANTVDSSIDPKNLNNTNDLKGLLSNDGLHLSSTGVDELVSLVKKTININNSSTSATPASLSPVGENKDYRGESVFTDDQLSKIKEYQPLYEKGVADSGYPWQMIAVIHLRESGLRRINPLNGQGLFQDYHKKHPDWYTPGVEVDDDLFVKQISRAVEEMDGKLNLGNKQLGLNKTRDDIKNKDPETIKMIFLGYNGFAQVYKKQAERLGFSNWADGSPYVMNRADEKRDPTVDPTKSNNTWGQIKTDGGSISYPANKDHGAYVMFTALGGGGSSSSSIYCDPASNLAQGLLDLAEYKQCDDQWRSLPYAGGNLCSSGCGVASSAMIISTLKKQKITPDSILPIVRKYKAEVNGAGSSGYNLLNMMSEEYGFRVQNLNPSNKSGLKDRIEESLRSGGIILTSGKGPKPYTTGGHFVVIYKIGANGNWLIGDPAPTKGEPVLKEYNPQLLVNYSHNAMGAIYAN